MTNLKDVKLKPVFYENAINCSQLEGDFTNSYYVVSDREVSKLLNSPETIGFDVYKALVPSTTAVLKYFNEKQFLNPINILTILRGALNYPMEESCFLGGIPVHDISFLSCERVFDDAKRIIGLDIKYSKLDIVPNATLLMGDILASGETFEYCLKVMLNHYKENNAKLRNIVFFTIGGTNAIHLAETYTKKIREWCPEFEGFIVIFYGGMFTCYEDSGVIGFQIKDIDFYWGTNGRIDPYYREITLSTQNPIFEKCIIYDGGARRYEIYEHIQEVLEYWEKILETSDSIDLFKLLEERLGHPLDLTLEEWVKVNGYDYLEDELSNRLYNQEQTYIQSLKDSKVTIKEIAEERIQEFKNALQIYIDIQ